MKFKGKGFLLLIVMLCMLWGAGTIQASAQTVNVISSAKKTSGGKWVKSSQGLKYRLKNGKYAKDSWRKIKGKVYYFDTEGICAQGWFVYGEGKYYATSINRVCYKEWHKIGKKYYYFQKDGRLTVNKLVKTGKKYYYVGAKGARVKASWVEIKGKKYYFDKNGVRLQKKWLKKKGKYYYFASNGVMAKNKWVGEYYVGPDGARLTNCEVDGYYLDSKGKRTVKSFTGKYIFLGDSRMVGMFSAVSSSDIKYIAKISMGYSWLNSTAGPTLKNYLNSNPNVKVVLALGINDLGNIQSYITYYQNLIKKYPKTQFYILSVNPVNEKTGAAHGYTVKNSQIKTFNKKLKSAFGSAYLDSYTYLEKQGISTPDGIHYQPQTYLTLFNYIIDYTK